MVNNNLTTILCSALLLFVGADWVRLAHAAEPSCTHVTVIVKDRLDEDWQGAEERARGKYHNLAHYSPSQLAELFERPRTMVELLKNLKLAVDRDWLTHPEFFDERVLPKLLNATTVTWKPNPLRKNVVSRTGNVLFAAGSSFAAMTVSVESNELHYARVAASATSPEQPAHSTHVGFLKLNMEKMPDISVPAVVAVFGTPIDSRADTGEATDGVWVTPTSKGSLIYDYSRRVFPPAVLEHNLTTFVLKRPDPPVSWPPAWRQGHFVCTADVIKSITIEQREY